MTLKLTLKPATQARLREEAERRGLTVDACVEALLDERLTAPAAEPRRRSWREIRGAAPYPLLGEDAQTWVTRSRREADEGCGSGDRHR